jgi:hypothetical protein
MRRGVVGGDADKQFTPEIQMDSVLTIIALMIHQPKNQQPGIKSG